MRVVSILVALVAVIGLILAGIGILIQTPIFSVSSGGYLRGASALFLLAIFLILYDQCYCKAKASAPPRRRKRR